ncbi:hypothetical protein C9374_005297 [Naegleria lovaniensis]|uniref:Uncharacterized protein n=1 Tax=Naegleria lovaniensis TaxID=51637 RepID=A0AA88GQZ5_NAELO|nr:uncharacterized protein C9374_005297 [Naegleria lovaniensis]KAG2382717.1 hypothetical protein C9374_005297 [Naegleria lovaniensis]
MTPFLIGPKKDQAIHSRTDLSTTRSWSSSSVTTSGPRKLQVNVPILPFPNVRSMVPQSPLPLMQAIKQEEESDTTSPTWTFCSSCSLTTPLSRYVQSQRGEVKESQVYIQRMRRVEMLKKEESLKRNLVECMRNQTMSFEQISVTFDEDLKTSLPVSSEQLPMTWKLNSNEMAEFSQTMTATPNLETTFVCDRKRNICRCIRRIRARHYRSFKTLTPSQKAAWKTLNNMLKTF